MFLVLLALFLLLVPVLFGLCFNLGYFKMPNRPISLYAFNGQTAVMSISVFTVPLVLVCVAIITFTWLNTQSLPPLYAALVFLNAVPDIEHAQMFRAIEAATWCSLLIVPSYCFYFYNATLTIDTLKELTLARDLTDDVYLGFVISAILWIQVCFLLANTLGLVFCSIALFVSELSTTQFGAL